MPDADPRPPSRAGGSALPFGILLAAVVLVSINLRPGASSPGPVLEEVRDGLGMSAGIAGAMTGLPGLCFGLVGALAVGFARKVGMTTAVAVGLTAAAAGLLLRVTTDSVPLFLFFTVLALAGMAVGNVIVPAWVKAHGHAVVLMTVYGTGLVVGGTIGSLATAPVTESSGSWQTGLGMWGVLVLVAVPLWVGLALRERRSPAEHSVSGEAPPSGRIIHSPTAVGLTVLFGVQSMHAYVQFGWLPTIYRDAGLSASTAGALQALLSSVGILGALAMPTVIARSIERGKGLQVWIWSYGVTLALGYTGLLRRAVDRAVAVGAAARLLRPRVPDRDRPDHRSHPPPVGDRPAVRLRAAHRLRARRHRSLRRRPDPRGDRRLVADHRPARAHRGAADPRRAACREPDLRRRRDLTSPPRGPSVRICA